MIHAARLAIVLLVLLVPAAAAQAVLPPTVGRIEGGPNGHCSGVLVAPDQVLTLGSCLIGPFGGAPEGERLRFSAGLTPEGSVAMAAGARLILHPSHMAGPGFHKGYFADAALLVLEAPLTGVDPVPARDAATGRDYAIAHYPAQRTDRGTAVVRRCRAWPLRAPYRPYECDGQMGQATNGAIVLDLGRGQAALAGMVRPTNRTRGGAFVDTLDAGPMLSDLRALAAGRKVPRVLLGGTALSGRELPGRIGIVRP